MCSYRSPSLPPPQWPRLASTRPGRRVKQGWSSSSTPKLDRGAPWMWRRRPWWSRCGGAPTRSPFAPGFPCVTPVLVTNLIVATTRQARRPHLLRGLLGRRRGGPRGDYGLLHRAGRGGDAGLCDGHADDSVCQGLRPAPRRRGEAQQRDAPDGALSVDSLCEENITSWVNEHTSTSNAIDLLSAHIHALSLSLSLSLCTDPLTQGAQCRLDQSNE
jgi:hypothetical protein